MVARVREIMKIPASMVTRVPDRPGHDRRYALNDSKLRRLGFKFKYPFEEALAQTIEWYKAREDWWRPLKQTGGYAAYYQKQYKKGTVPFSRAS